MDNDMSKFYIGQKIVAIKDHSQGIFKKGDEFTVFGISNRICKCNETLIDVGFKMNHDEYICDSCNKICTDYERINWFYESCFAPIELSNTTFEDVIKQLEPCLN